MVITGTEMKGKIVMGERKRAQQVCPRSECSATAPDESHTKSKACREDEVPRVLKQMTVKRKQLFYCSQD